MATRVVVEWTRTSLRLAVAESQGIRSRLQILRSQPLATGDEGAGALRALLGTTKGATDVISVIPREQVITRVVKFPAVDPVELAHMVSLYAKAQLPYPGDQAITDFHIVSRREGFSTVAIVACQREVVERPLAMLREAGLSSSAVTISSWGLLGWYQQLLDRPGDYQSQLAAHEPCLVVNVDETRVDIVLMTGDRIVSSRSMAQGEADWRAVADPTELLALEIERSRAAARKELAVGEARSIVLTGLGPLDDWKDRLSRRVDLPVVMVPAQQPFVGPAALAVSPGWSPVVVGGLACGRMRELLNLNPPQVRAHLRHRRQVRELVTVSALVMGVLVMGAGVLALQAVREQRLAVQLDRVVTELEPAAKQVQAKGRSASTVGSMLEERRQVAAMLAGIFRTLPPVVALEGVAFERARHETILRGAADSTQTVLDYVQQLSRLEGVGAVDLRYSTRRSTPAGDRVDFELLLRVLPAAASREEPHGA